MAMVTLPYYVYFCIFVLIIAVLVIASVLLRKVPHTVVYVLVIALSFVNLFQHLFKQYIFPNLANNGFSYLNTAYNVCAFLVIVAPFVHIWAKKAVKDFICALTFGAGALAMLIPYWYINTPAQPIELIRFYLCHGLLLFSGGLPVFTGQHKLSWRNWYKTGFILLLSLVLILANDILCVYMGLTNYTVDHLYEALNAFNPLWSVRPSGSFEWLATVLDPITPDIFFSNGNYVPILWYAYPLYIVVSIVSLIGFGLADRKRLVADMKGYGERIKALFFRSKACLKRLFFKKSQKAEKSKQKEELNSPDKAENMLSMDKDEKAQSSSPNV